eukprot:14202679-Heterocapsa_arctica.AAC.1
MGLKGGVGGGPGKLTRKGNAAGGQGGSASSAATWESTATRHGMQLADVSELRVKLPGAATEQAVSIITAEEVRKEATGVAFVNKRTIESEGLLALRGMVLALIVPGRTDEAMKTEFAKAGLAEGSWSDIELTLRDPNHDWIMIRT